MMSVIKQLKAEQARRKIKKSRSPYDFVKFKRMKAVATKVIKAATRRG